MYCLNMLEIALVLAGHDRAYEDIATKFFEHFALHRRRAATSRACGTSEDGFFYDVLPPADGRADAAAGALDGRAAAAVRDDHAGQRDPGAPPDFAERCPGSSRTSRSRRGGRGQIHADHGAERRLLRSSGRRAAADPRAGCSTRPSSSRRTACARSRGAHPRTVRARPAPSCTLRRLRAGRVDHRPVRRQLQLARARLVPGQLPVIEALRRFAAFFGDDLTRRAPDRLRDPAARSRRSPTTWRPGWSPSSCATATAAGRCSAATRGSRTTRAGTTCCSFHEYFHGDTGAGLGASHQTGWTGLVADLILRRRTGRP